MFDCIWVFCIVCFSHKHARSSLQELLVKTTDNSSTQQQQELLQQYYPAICAEATASFTVISSTIRAVIAELQQQNQAGEATTSVSEIIDTIRQLQKHEHEKLEMTAALHLEQLQQRIHTLSNTSSDTVMSLHETSIKELQERITTLSVETIQETIVSELQQYMCEE